MRFLALACDYDGTVAHHGVVADQTVEALQRVKESGRQLLLVTGREVDDLCTVFPQIDLFDRVVAENGAVVYEPRSRRLTPLAEPPPPGFIAALRERGLSPLSVGEVIVATREPGQNLVLRTIRDLGLELQVIFNKGAVMVLPAGVNKATGLAAALGELDLSAHNVVGVGDAENDHAFLAACECGVAVANALPMLKERADIVTSRPHGEGVIELAEELARDDLASRGSALDRHRIMLGVGADSGDEIRIPPYGPVVLIAGSSGGGKSTLATGLLERLAAAGYQFCVIDPEGDYATLGGAVTLGTPERAPEAAEAAELLDRPSQCVVVNLIAVRFEDRPSFFREFLARVQELRARTGRPHWIVVDEAHHVLPSARDPSPGAAGAVPAPHSSAFITVEPASVSTDALRAATLVVGVGEAREKTIASYCQAVGSPEPPMTGADDPAAVLLWDRDPGREPVPMLVPASRSERLRHRRKYAQGELPPDRSFYFRGPGDRLNLRAQNLQIFLQIADGVDDETWEHHRARGDFSAWFREMIKDDELADEARRVEEMEHADPRFTRDRIREAVERRFTLPA